jgi:hypothetical protein
MFDGLWGLAADALRRKGYSDEEVNDSLYALKHCDWRFVLDKRKENKMRKVTAPVTTPLTIQE